MITHIEEPKKDGMTISFDKCELCEKKLNDVDISFRQILGHLSQNRKYHDHPRCKNCNCRYKIENGGNKDVKHTCAERRSSTRPKQRINECKKHTR